MGQVLKMRRPSAARLECSACGASCDAACNCGAEYVPAGRRAVEAVKANPGRSNRAIADEIGVDEKMVRNARKTGADNSAPGPQRVGKDGKKYTARPKPRPQEYEEPGVEDEIDGEDPENYRTAFLLRVDQAKRFAAYSGPATKELIAAARAVAAAWTKLAQNMEKSQ